MDSPTTCFTSTSRPPSTCSTGYGESRGGEGGPADDREPPLSEAAYQLVRTESNAKDHDLDNQVRGVLAAANRKAFDNLAADVDGLRIDRFHQEVYQRLRPYNTGQGFIGQSVPEKKQIEEVIRKFADQVADFAERFLLIEQYDHIDELILTGGGCNIPLVREAVRKKLGRYNLKNSHIPLASETDLPARCRKLDRLLIRGATALGATSVFFDYH